MALETTTHDEPITLSRRQAMTALGAGAVALTATHLGVAYGSAQFAQQEPEREVAALTQEVEQLKGLIALYENLERTGIDSILSGALSVIEGSLAKLRGGVGFLRTGVSTIEGALSGFQNSFAVIRSGLQLTEGAVDGVAALLKNTETVLGQATSPVKPLFQQVRDFFDNLLDRIPFGVGDNIRRTIDGVIDLIAAVPGLIASVSANLIEPLRTGWFSDENAKNIQGGLFDPITSKLVSPLKSFLGDVDQTLAHWESDVATPVQTALDQRAGVRKQIAEYKRQHGMS